MKIQLNIGFIAALGGIWALPVMAADSADVNDTTQTELTTVLHQHTIALNKQDLKTLMTLYGEDTNVTLIGTGPGEFWKGKAEIADAYQHLFEDFKPGSLHQKCAEIISHLENQTAWMATSCTTQDVMRDGQKREYDLNISGVLRKEKTGWKFQMLHFSNAAATDLPPPEKAPSPEDAPPLQKVPSQP